MESRVSRVAARALVPAQRLQTQTNQCIACDATGDTKQGSNLADWQKIRWQGKAWVYFAAAISSTMDWAAARGS